MDNETFFFLVLKNLPSGNNAFMKSFKKIRMKKMSLNTKLTRKFLNQLQNVPRNYVQTLCTNFKKNQMPKKFNMAFEKSTHKYPTQFSETNFKYKKYCLTSTKNSISVRGPKILNEFLTKEEKEIQSHSIFL